MRIHEIRAAIIAIAASALAACGGGGGGGVSSTPYVPAPPPPPPPAPTATMITGATTSQEFTVAGAAFREVSFPDYDGPLLGTEDLPRIRYDADAGIDLAQAS